MPNDPATLIGIGVAIVVGLWLVFSVLKRLLALALIAAIVAAIAFLWFNPEIARQLWAQVQAMTGLG